LPRNSCVRLKGAFRADTSTVNFILALFPPQSIFV
jgi:hypothetical protein